MLDFFRQHVGGMLGVIIIGMIVFVFALNFGVQSKGWGQGSSEEFVATVDGHDISEMTFRYAVNLLGGREIGREDPSWAPFRQSVMEGLIERELLLHMAAEAGITASKDMAEERIANNEVYLSRPIKELAEELDRNFFVDPAIAARVLIKEGHRIRHSFDDEKGAFDLEGFRKFVRYYLQSTEESFVEQQRLEIVAERMRELLVMGVRVSESEVHDAYLRDHDTVKLSYIRLMPSYFTDRLAPTPEDLTKFAAEHADEIKQYYETNKFNYTNLEKLARARHILIKVAEDATDEDKKAAREKIDGILARLKAGEDFAALARQFSEDTGSSQKGGDLGYTPKGRMVPEFDNAMFDLAPGKMSEVVTTKYGFHIIKLEGFREGNVTLEQATPEIAEELYRKQTGEKQMQETANGFLARLKAGEQMAALIPPAEGDPTPEALRLQVRETQPFSRSTTVIPGVGEARDLVAAAFALTADKPLADHVFKVRGDLFVVRLAERSAPTKEEYDKLKDGIAEKMLALKQASWLRERMRSLVDAAEKSGNLERKLRLQPATPAGDSEPATGPKGDTPVGPPGKTGKTDKPDKTDRPEQADRQADKQAEAPEGE
jgi:peptidyl-prolyl cis-trans isomerase D